MLAARSQSGDVTSSTLFTVTEWWAGVISKKVAHYRLTTPASLPPVKVSAAVLGVAVAVIHHVVRVAQRMRSGPCAGRNTSDGGGEVAAGVEATVPAEATMGYCGAVSAPGTP